MDCNFNSLIQFIHRFWIQLYKLGLLIIFYSRTHLYKWGFNHLTMAYLSYILFFLGYILINNNPTDNIKLFLFPFGISGDMFALLQGIMIGQFFQFIGQGSCILVI